MNRMENPLKDQIIIDGLQYCNWNRELFEDLLSGGLTAIHATVSYWENTDETNKRLDYWDNLFYEFNDLILPVLTAEDIILAKTSNKTGIMLGFQNCSPIENDVFMVEENNEQLPDLGTYELKTHGDSDALNTLKSIEPGPKKRNALITPIVRDFGWETQPQCPLRMNEKNCTHKEYDPNNRCYPVGTRSGQGLSELFGV